MINRNGSRKDAKAANLPADAVSECAGSARDLSLRSMEERRGVTAHEAGVTPMARISAHRVEDGGPKLDGEN